MKSLVFTALVLASSARAECLTVDDLETGIAVSHESGAVSVVKTAPDGISVETTDPETGERFRIVGPFGVYPVFETILPAGNAENGHRQTGTRRIFILTGEAKTPSDSMMRPNFYRMLSETIDETENLSGHYTTTSATFTGSMPRRASLSGCDYDFVTLDAAFQGDPLHLGRRWVYFEDLGFGVMIGVTLADGREMTNYITGVTRYEGK